MIPALVNELEIVKFITCHRWNQLDKRKGRSNFCQLEKNENLRVPSIQLFLQGTILHIF